MRVLLPPASPPRWVALAALAWLAGCGRGAAPPSFDADALPDAYAAPSGALMEPGTTRAWEITPEGNLYNGAWRLRVGVSSGTVEGPPPRRIAAEDRWRPVLHWSRRSGPVRWDFSALARTAPAPRDSELIASIEITARNTSARRAPARLELRLEAGEPHPAFVAWDATDEPPRWGGRRSEAIVHAWAAGTPLEPRRLDEWLLDPGESRALRVVLPAYPTRERDLARFADRDHEAYAVDVRRGWDAALARGATFALGDPETENALRAAEIVLLCCRERRGPRWVPIGGPFQYRDVWLRDGARAIAALAAAGQTDVARELADGLMLFQWSSGAFLSQRGQLDGNGQAVWAMEQALLRPAPARDVARFANAAAAAARWTELQRALGARLESAYPLMLPFAEPRDGELTRAQLTGNDAWGIAGERAAARLLRAAGRDTDALEMERAASAYRADFAAALAKSGSRDLPPSWQGPGRDWGNFAVAWPCEAVAPDDPRAAAFAERVWRAGGGAGLAFYATTDSLHGYLGADLGVWAMLAGRRAEAESVLDAQLHWRTASGTAAELFTHDGAFGANLPPHPTSAAALWLLVRNALIFDDDDTLRLTMAARERWWRAAQLRAAPTRWGRMDLRFSADAARARWRWTPVPVWTALTLPPGMRLAAAPSGPMRGEPGGTRVWAPPGTREAAVAIERGPRP